MSTDSDKESDEENLDISVKAPKLPLSVTKEQSEPVSDIPQKPAITNQPKPNPKLILVFATIFVVMIGIVAGGIFVFQKATLPSDSNADQTQTPLPDSPDSATSPTPTPEPTPDPKSEIDKSSVKINILNGSGTPGAAGKLEGVLKTAEFENLDTGNADSYDFKSTQISVKADNQPLLDLLKDSLKDDYTIGDTDTSLDTDSKFDAVITVGSE